MIVALMTLACAPRTAGFGASPAHIVEPTGPVAYEAIGGTAAAPAIGWVRAIDDFAAAVPSDPVTLTVGGLPVTISFDGLGYADVVADVPGQSVTVEGASAPANVHAIAGTWFGLGLDPGTQPQNTAPAHAATVDGAVLVAGGSEVWWVPVGANTSHLVLRADGDIVGLRARDVDVDGATDAVAWTATTAYLLRARLDGGMARGAVLRADGLGLGGADIGDLNGDKLPDLAVGWTDGATHVLDVWSGDGEWNFTPATPRSLVTAPADLVIGDNTGEGVAQITVLHEDGEWSRFLEAKPDLFMQVGPSTPRALQLDGEGSLLSQGDMTGDGAVELYALDPLLPGQDRRASVMQVDRDVLVLESLGHPGAQAALGDGNADGLEDLFLLAEDGILSAVWFEKVIDANGVFHPIDVEQWPEPGPIALGRWFGDDLVPDLFTAGLNLWAWRRGGTATTDDTTFWHSAPPPVQTYGTAHPGPMAVAELDGDPVTVDVVSFAPGVDGTRLVVASYAPGAAGVQRGSVPVGPNGGPVTDFDICGDIAWVVADATLSRVDLGGGTPSLSADNSTAATRIACGTLGGNAEAALLVDDEYVTLTASAVASGDRVPAGGAQDLTIADLGDGPRIHACYDAGCRLTSWRRPTDTVLAIGTPHTTTLHGLSGDTSYSGGGFPQVVDADGNGIDDLLVIAPSAGAAPQTTYALYLAADDTVAKPLLWSTPIAASAWGGLGDGDGDGSPDLWTLDAAGTLLHTISPLPPPDDTTDTGAP